MMTAKEYYEQYREKLVEEDGLPVGEIGEATKQFYLGFVDDMQSIIKDRHVHSDKAVVAVVKEVNQKWNAVCNLFEKNYNRSPIRRDGFYNAIRVQVPEMPEL